MRPSYITRIWHSIADKGRILLGHRRPADIPGLCRDLLSEKGEASGTAAILAMRGDLLRCLPEHPELRAVDADMQHLLRSWFNRGFLVLKRIDWNTPAATLETLFKYEAVHAIQGWSDMRRRLEDDRRCFAFFHQALPDPLIFVEVALVEDVPQAVGPLLDREALPQDSGTANTAVFYSINNCQDGLRGISLGHFLIK